MTPPPAHSPIAAYGIIIFISLIIGGVLNSFSDPYLPASLSNTQKGYQSGFAAAKAVVASSTSSNSVIPDVRTVEGTVTAVSGATFTLKVASLNQGDDPSLATRTVTTNASTTVMKVALKDPATYQAEMTAYLAKQKQTGSTTGTQPVNFNVVGGNVSDIKVGDAVSVLSLVNIKTAKDITARYIQIIPKTTP